MTVNPAEDINNFSLFLCLCVLSDAEVFFLGASIISVEVKYTHA